jgi:hypothetical protein
VSLARELAAQPTIGAAGLIQSVSGLLIATLIVVAWWGLGSAILRCVVSRRELGSRALDYAIRCLLGAGAWSTFWLFVGLVKLYRAPVAVGALALGLALAVLAWRREEPVFVAKGPRPWPEISLIALVTGLTLVAALAPPTANDALLYHLAMPKAYAAAGGMVQVEYSMASYFTLGVEMHALWSMLLGGVVSPRTAEAAAGATLFAFAPLTVLATYGWARARALDRTWSALAALMVAAIPSVYFVAAGQGVDVTMAGYAAVAIFAVGRWWTTLETAWLRLDGRGRRRGALDQAHRRRPRRATGAHRPVSSASPRTVEGRWHDVRRCSRRNGAVRARSGRAAREPVVHPDVDLDGQSAVSVLFDALAG